MRQIRRELGKDYAILCQVLRKVNAYSLAKWRQELSGQGLRTNEATRSLYYNLIRIKNPMRKDELGQLVQASGNMNFIFENPIYLPPSYSDCDFIPLLHVECRLDESPPILNLRIGMFRLDSQDKIKGIGFRFDSAHSTESHAYHHIQLCVTPFADENLNRVLDCPKWFPRSTPAIIMAAENPVSFVLLSLFCFYGKDVFTMISDANIGKMYTGIIGSLMKSAATW